MEEYEKKFLEQAKQKIDQYFKSERETLECEPEYFLGYDSDFVDIGVGMACVRREEILDEDALDEDAKQATIDDRDDIIDELTEAFEEFIKEYLK
jgi:hypothetical protein